MQGMQFDLDEVLNEAIMTKTPCVIVEGVDDIPVYDGIINSSDRNVEVIAIEVIEGYSKGCDQVVEATKKLSETIEFSYDPADYVLGIIDKDVRDFREELPENRLLLVLDVYSIESHFVNPEVIEDVIRICTKSSSDMNTQELRNHIFLKCSNNMEVMFLASLEALKGAVDQSYSAEIGYSAKYGRMKDQNLIQKLEQKKNELYEFSMSIGISNNLSDLKKICKGKWLLCIFCEELEKTVLTLPDFCGKDEVVACKMCFREIKNSCMYRIHEGFSHKTMREIIRNSYRSEEMKYIRTRALSMGSAVN